jgi:hypothetical protein
MVNGFSVRARRLVSTWNQALLMTSPSGSRIAQLKTVPPGRRMTSVPTKPPATRAQRSGETSSFRVVAASRVTTSGAISTIEVNSASGM